MVADRWAWPRAGLGSDRHGCDAAPFFFFFGAGLGVMPPS